MSRARDLADGNFSGDLEADSPTFVVDSANNRVGIGTASPSTVLHAVGTGQSVRMQDSAGVAKYVQVKSDSTNSHLEHIGGPGDALLINNQASGTVEFLTANTERMRIDSSGNLLVGKTTSDISIQGIHFGNSSNSRILLTNSADYGIELYGTTTARMRFHTSAGGSGPVGSITVSGSATAYNTSSDYRLKEDVQPMVGASDRLMALKPVNFAWKVDGTRVDGFLAHEAQEIVPEAVHGTKDAMRDEEYEVTPAVYDDDGNLVSEAVMGTRSVPDYQGIDQSKLVPLLTAALQEALQKIDALEARVATLEGGA